MSFLRRITLVAASIFGLFFDRLDESVVELLCGNTFGGVSFDPSLGGGLRNLSFQRFQVLFAVGNPLDAFLVELRTPGFKGFVVVVVDVVVERGLDRREQGFAMFFGKLGERVAIDDDRTVDRARVEVCRPPLSCLDGAEGHVRVRSKRDGFDDTAVEGLSNFGCRHGGGHSTECLEFFLR